MEIRESDKANAIQFALAMRKAISDPAKWAKLICVSRDIVPAPTPADTDDLLVVALAYLMAISSARTLPETDPVRRSAEKLLNSIIAFAR